MIDRDGYDDDIKSATYNPSKLRCPLCLVVTVLISIIIWVLILMAGGWL